MLTKRKTNIENFIFYIFWSILLVGKGLGLNSKDTIYIYMTYSAVIFAALKLFITKWTKKELMVTVLLNVLGIIIWYFSKDAAALLLTITITSLKGIDIKKVLNYSLLILASLFIIKVTLALNGVIDKQMLIRYDSGNVHTVRYALGYIHPNATQSMVFVIFSLIILKYKNKIKVIHYIIMFLINYWMFRYTNSRTGFLVTTSLLLITWLYSRKWNDSIKGMIYWFSERSYIIGAMISLIICFSFSKFTILLKYTTLASRVITAINTINTHGFPLFGFPNIVTDWGYISMLYDKGIIFFVLFIISMSKLLMYFKEKNDTYSVAVFVSIAIYTLTEAYFSSIVVNIPLLYLGILLHGNSFKKETI